MLQRALRAAALDPRIYREVGAAPELVLQSFLLVGISAVAFGLGLRNTPVQAFEDTPAMVVLLAGSTILVGWMLWALTAYVVGTLVLRGTAGFRRLLRALGMAYAPGVLLILFEVPRAGQPIFTLTLFWVMAGGVVAVREAQGYDWVRSALAGMLGWALAFVFLPGILLGAPAAA